jgi:hypothetical protein
MTMPHRPGEAQCRLPDELRPAANALGGAAHVSERQRDSEPKRTVVGGGAARRPRPAGQRPFPVSNANDGPRGAPDRREAAIGGAGQEIAFAPQGKGPAQREGGDPTATRKDGVQPA